MQGFATCAHLLSPAARDNFFLFDEIARLVCILTHLGITRLKLDLEYLCLMTSGNFLVHFHSKAFSPLALNRGDLNPSLIVYTPAFCLSFCSLLPTINNCRKDWDMGTGTVFGGSLLYVTFCIFNLAGFVAPCSHYRVSNHLNLLSESFPSESSHHSTSIISNSNRNRCALPGTFFNTNTIEGFRELDRPSLLKEEAKKVCHFLVSLYSSILIDSYAYMNTFIWLNCQIWDDIHNGEIEKECALLSRFLLISFADLKKWRFYYSVAVPALVLNPPATLATLKPASEWFSLEEV